MAVNAPRAVARRLSVSTSCITCLIALASASGQTVTWDGGGDGTSWHDADNWNPTGLPGPADDVLIDDPGTIAIVHSQGVDSINSLICHETLHLEDDSLTIATTSTLYGDYIQNSGGTLTVNGDLTIAGLLDWHGGVINGAGTVYANGGIDFVGSAYWNFIIKCDMVNAQTATWTGSGIYIGDGAQFTNALGAVFDMQSNHNIVPSTAPAGTFLNEGTIRKSAGTGDSRIQVVLTDTGTIESQTGTVQIRDDSTHTGSLTGPGTIEFSLGTHTIEASCNIDAGTVVFDAGTTDVHGTYNSPTVVDGDVNFHPDCTIVSVGSHLVVSAGTADFSSGEPIIVTTYDQSSPGTFTGDSDLTVSGLLTFAGGTMSGTGTTYANGGLELIASAYYTIILSRDLVNNASATWTNGGAGFYINNGALFSNPPGAVFDIQNNAAMNTNGGGTFDNQGTIVKSAGTGETRLDVILDNTGLIDVQTGRVEFRGDEVITGEVSGPGTVEFGTGTHLFEAGSILDVGFVEFNQGTTDIHGSYSGDTSVGGGTTTFHPDSTVLWIGENLVVDGGTVDFSSGDALSITTLDLSNPGTFTGSNDLTVSGLVTWAGGTMAGDGTLYADGGIDFIGSAYYNIVVKRDVVNAATATWTLSSTLWLNEGAQFTNLAGAVFDMQNSRNMTTTDPTCAFINEGMLVKSAGTGISSVRVPFSNTGTVDVPTGTLEFREGCVQSDGEIIADSILKLIDCVVDLQGGVLMGTGYVDGEVANASGDVTPGASTGTLTIENFTQQCEGDLVIEISDTANDVMAVDLDADLFGTLRIELLGGYEPPVGTTYDIITATNVLGQFDCLDDPQPGGNHFAITYGTDLVTLTVSSGPPIYGDVTLDDNVDVLDLLVVLANWGACDCTCCPADVNGDGTVNVLDLLDVLAAWSA